jgi:hypothetical protein
MLSDYTANILNVYMRASTDEYEHGMNWYSNAHDLALKWSRGDLWKGAGIIAAYSPLTPWWRNMELAMYALYHNTPRVDTLSNSWQAVNRILHGEHALSVLRGPKVRAFAISIADPNTQLVTVDSHAHSVAIGHHLTTNQSKLNVTTRNDIIRAYIESARYAGIQVSAMQAITWTVWRNEHPNKAARQGG